MGFSFTDNTSLKDSNDTTVITTNIKETNDTTPLTTADPDEVIGHKPRTTRVSFGFVSIATDLADSERCHESWKIYSSLRYEPPAELKSEVRVITEILETWQQVGDGGPYTESCDGIPRYSWNSPPTTSTSKSVTVSYTSAVYPELDFNRPMEPVCLADEEYCHQAFQNWRKEQDAQADIDLEVEGFKNSTSFGACRFWMMRKTYKNSYACALEHDSEVMLFFWPPIQSSRDSCGSNGYGSAITMAPNITFGHTHVTSAITFPGQDLYTRFWKDSDMSDSDGGDKRWNMIDNHTIGASTLTGPFTFTYPFVYLAHRDIIRTDDPQESYVSSGSLVLNAQYPDPTVVRKATIVAMNTPDVYSAVFQKYNTETGVRYAQLVAQGKFKPQFERARRVMDQRYWDATTHLPFDFGHMQNPVPARIYFDARKDCWGAQSHCGTITDDSYHPTLAIKNRV
jgi:hypothetical protein